MQDGTKTETNNNQPDTGTELDNQDIEQEKEELMAVHVDPLTLLNNNITIKPIIEEINMDEQKNMEVLAVPQINNYGVDNVLDVIDFAGTGYAITQKALANDGKITKDEWINYAPLLLKVFPLITSIGSVPKELMDTITEEEEAKIIAKLKETISDITDEKAKEMILDIMLMLFDIQQFVKKYFFPTTAEPVTNG